jgi:hypothetical protein
VGAYGNAKSIKMKTAEQLKELRANGLGILYMGLESGDDTTLAAINKGPAGRADDRHGAKSQSRRHEAFGHRDPGDRRRERSHIHAVATGKVLSAIDPDYVGALSLMLVPNTPLYADFGPAVSRFSKRRKCCANCAPSLTTLTCRRECSTPITLPTICPYARACPRTGGRAGPDRSGPGWKGALEAGVERGL